MNNEEIKKYFMRLSQIKYGWHDKKGTFHSHLKEGNFFKDFYFQTNEEIKKTSSAICWEICELEREEFTARNIPNQTIYAGVFLHHKLYCHTFLVYKKEDTYYWIEPSWEKMKGIYQGKTITELLNKVYENFDSFTHEKFPKEKIFFRIYTKPKPRIRAIPFHYHCIVRGKKIKF